MSKICGEMNLWLVRLDARVPGTDLQLLIEGETKEIARDHLRMYLKDTGRQYFEPRFELIDVYEGMVREV